MSVPEFVLLSRPGCHLCEALAEEFQALAGGAARLRVLDIDEYPQWRAQYGLRIPVLLDPDGSLCAELRLNPDRLQPWLAPASGTDRAG